MNEKDETAEEPTDKTGSLTKEKLVKIVRRILRTDHPLDFLMNLRKQDLETLAACIRERVDNGE